jgi:hypothetical protein
MTTEQSYEGRLSEFAGILGDRYTPACESVVMCLGDGRFRDLSQISEITGVPEEDVIGAVGYLENVLREVPAFRDGQEVMLYRMHRGVTNSMKSRN